MAQHALSLLDIAKSIIKNKQGKHIFRVVILLQIVIVHQLSTMTIVIHFWMMMIIGTMTMTKKQALKMVGDFVMFLKNAGCYDIKVKYNNDSIVVFHNHVKYDDGPRTAKYWFKTDE